MELSARELFFDGAPFPALLLDRAGAVVAVNPRARGLLGEAESAGLLGFDLGELFDTAGRLAWDVALHELGADGRLEPMVMRAPRRSSGRPRDLLVSASAWSDESGSRAAIAVTLIDVTDRIGVERDVQALAARYRSTLETARDAILLLDAETQVSQVNGAARALFEAPGNHLVGRSMLDLLDGAAARTALIEALAASEREDGSGAERLAVTCRTLTGSRRFPADVSVSRFTTDEGVRYTAIVRDETEREALQHALEEKARQLTRKNEELEAFSYSVSHALKAPLRTMGSFAGLLYSRYREQLDETGSRYLSFLVETCREQGRQIEQLLELSRLASSEEAPEAIAVEPVVRQILDYHVVNAAPRLIDVRLAAELPTVRIQRQALYHLFDNLIGNAIKFTAQEEVAEVEIGYEAEADRHHFWVRDNGIGIAESDHEQVFRLFTRLHRQEEYEGTGAGLNIVTKILERHGGELRLESELGAGATFHVYLPLVAP